MQISKEQLISAIYSSMATREICIPRTDYYANPNDYTTIDITYVDAESLINALKDME